MKRITHTLLLFLMATASSFGQAFVTTWKTDNPGTSNSNQITIPTGAAIYLYNVDWGDGSDDTGLNGSVTHTYTSAGTYTVSITGTFPYIYFNNGGDKDKILTVEQWGSGVWSSFRYSFYGCSNLQINASDAPDLSNVTDMSGVFRGATSMNSSINHWDVSNVQFTNQMFFLATSFNQPLNNWVVASVIDMSSMFASATAFNQPLDSWNVENVTDLSGMFNGASSFNQPIGNWNVANATKMNNMLRDTDFNQDISSWNVGMVTTMNAMFRGATDFDQNLGSWNISNVTDMASMFFQSGLTSANYDNILIGWAAQTVKSGVSLNASGVHYCLGRDARDILTNAPNNWVITDGGEECPPFITTWKTDNPGTSANNQITIPTVGTGYNYNVDWGDGNSDAAVTGDITHTYTSSGTYTVSISGDFPRIYFNNSGDKDKILTVDQWGGIDWTSMERAFFGCTNLNITATDAPDLDGVFSLSYMFQQAASLTADLNSWDVGDIVKMTQTFAQASNFNGDITSWDVGNVNDMLGMFAEATSFNQPIGNWNVSSVLDMNSMFKESNFNQDIGNWNVSNAQNLSQMFRDNTAFDQNIGNWNVSTATDLSYMFAGASEFNQPIGNWDLSLAVLMTNMFFRAESFNQDLSNWNISSVTNMTQMFNQSNLSSANYDNLLNSWSQQSVQSGVTFGASETTYCLGAAARNVLTSAPNNWTIIDGGENCIVFIPDANFKAALLANNSINTVDDGEISTQEALAFTGSLDVSNNSIADLTGIEAFTEITELNCSLNSLITLDLTVNTSLAHVNCRENQLTSIDISGLTLLEGLDLAFNQLTGIDVSTNSELQTLGANDNLLTDIDVSSNGQLKILYCGGNNLTSLDVSNNPFLEDLGCDNNQLTALDISSNPALKFLEANNNQFTSVNAANGNNAIIELFSISGNPNLTCITVDDVPYSVANWIDIDAAANFSTNCNNRIEQAITFDPIDDQFLEAGSLNLSATASSNLEVSFEIVSGPANLNGKVVSFTALGTVVVRASQPGNGEFFPADPVDRSIEIITVTGLEKEVSPFSVYPNPATDVLYIQSLNEDAVIRLMNINGVQVMDMEPNVANYISLLNKGTYILYIKDANRISTHRIIKK